MIVTPDLPEPEKPMHTPLPWEAKSEFLHDGSHVAGRGPLIFTNGLTLAKVVRQTTVRGKCAIAEANAELIVTAVNSHALLADALAALRHLISDLDRSKLAGSWLTTSAARAVLTKASELGL